MRTHTRDGRPYEPGYLLGIDKDACIGCGRCFEVCGQGVMSLKGIDEEGELVDPDAEEAMRKVMALDDAGACIGCGACARVCPKNCQTHGAQTLAA